MADYYKTLGIDKGADQKQIKSAFRKLAMKYHPDQNQGNAEAEVKFKELGEAYETLSDEQKRAAYDRYGHDAYTQSQQGGGGQGPFGGMGGGFGGGQGAGFSDIFEDLFGEFMGGGQRGAQGGRQSGRGADLKHDVTIDLKDAFKGAKKEINVPSSEACEPCEGSGAEPGSGPTTCSTCGGVGRVRAQQGFFAVERTCPSCQGMGQVIKTPCNECSGQGRVRKNRKLEVQIPAGVEDGTRIRLSGEGEAGVRGGPFGDLYLFVSVKNHKLFERDAEDLYCTATVPMSVAALGGEIETPTIDGGRVKIKIPAGAQTGRKFRLRDKGMTQLRNKHRGNMYVELQVETPQNLTARQKELLKEFNEEGGNSSPNSKNFFAQVKEFWDELT